MNYLLLLAPLGTGVVIGLAVAPMYWCRQDRPAYRASETPLKPGVIPGPPSFRDVHPPRAASLSPTNQT